MQNAPAIASDLLCQDCEWPLIKNGELRCKRSRHTVLATLGQEKVFCPRCRNPKVLLADENGRAICPQSECGQRTLIIYEEKTMAEITTPDDMANITREVLSDWEQEWLDEAIAKVEKRIWLLASEKTRKEVEIQAKDEGLEVKKRGKGKKVFYVRIGSYLHNPKRRSDSNYTKHLHEAARRDGVRVHESRIYSRALVVLEKIYRDAGYNVEIGTLKDLGKMFYVSPEGPSVVFGNAHHYQYWIPYIAFELPAKESGKGKNLFGFLKKKQTLA